jgi:hypothetical protein
MHGQAPTISTKELYAQLGTAAAPVVIDARKRDAFDADDRLIVGAVRYDFDANTEGSKNLPALVFLHRKTDRNKISGTMQPPRQMGLSPCKRCSRSTLGASNYGF